MFKIVSSLSQGIFLLLFFVNTNVYGQTLGELLEKILKKDESISSSRIAIDKANNDLSSVISLFTPKIDLSLPVGNEKLINNDDIDIEDTERLLRSSLKQKIRIRKVDYCDNYKSISFKKVTRDIIRFC